MPFFQLCVSPKHSTGEAAEATFYRAGLTLEYMHVCPDCMQVHALKSQESINMSHRAAVMWLSLVLISGKQGIAAQQKAAAVACCRCAGVCMSASLSMLPMLLPDLSTVHGDACSVPNTHHCLTLSLFCHCSTPCDGSRVRLQLNSNCILPTERH
jgi:hypothetical protein